jgi:hypothetical protein
MIFDLFKKKRVVPTGPRAKIWMMIPDVKVVSVDNVLSVIQIPKGYMNDVNQTEARLRAIKSRGKDSNGP